MKNFKPQIKTQILVMVFIWAAVFFMGESAFANESRVNLSAAIEQAQSDAAAEQYQARKEYKRFMKGQASAESTNGRITIDLSDASN